MDDVGTSIQLISRCSNFRVAKLENLASDTASGVGHGVPLPFIQDGPGMSGDPRRGRIS